MTGVGSTGEVARPEIVLVGSADGSVWHQIEFRFKPTDINRPPPLVAPHQPRLDWQMWFAALGDYSQNPWLMNLCFKLLSGSEPAFDLLAPGGQFSSRLPPKFLRATLFDYAFTSLEESRNASAAIAAGEGSYWVRDGEGATGEGAQGCGGEGREEEDGNEGGDEGEAEAGGGKWRNGTVEVRANQSLPGISPLLRLHPRPASSPLQPPRDTERRPAAPAWSRHPHVCVSPPAATRPTPRPRRSGCGGSGGTRESTSRKSTSGQGGSGNSSQRTSCPSGGAQWTCGGSLSRWRRQLYRHHACLDSRPPGDAPCGGPPRAWPAAAQAEGLYPPGVQSRVARAVVLARLAPRAHLRRGGNGGHHELLRHLLRRMGQGDQRGGARAAEE